MQNKDINKYYNDLLKYDVDYQELFYEETEIKRIYYINERIDSITSKFINGVGVTLSKGKQKFYGSTNNTEEIGDIIKNIGTSFSRKENKEIILEEMVYPTSKNHNNFTNEDKKNLFSKINTYCRNYDKRIIQVEITLLEKIQKVKIASSNKLNCDNRIFTRLAVSITAAENEKSVSKAYSPGFSTDYSFLSEIDLEKNLEENCKIALKKLETKSFKGGKMPVIIGPGFGAVIFHEACGHALESYSIVNKTSVLTNKKNQKIASDKVTLIDDGTIANLYGTTNIDDQGEKTKKNILIKNGILTEYLTDKIDAQLMQSKSTGSGRRENYTYSATSRMNNTYLKPGNDKIENMIKSIENGLYATHMGGGSVSPNTGEFNFTVNFGYVIKNGKINRPIKDVTLIGNTKDVLLNVEMVSDNLEYGPGVCGAYSGNCYNTCGQPTIKVSEILVGGNKDE